MNKRNKLGALLGAGLLTFGIAGIALANDLGTDHPAQVAPTTLDENVSDNGVVVDCSDFADLGILPGEGEVGLHFILTSPEAASGNISGSVDGTAFGPVANTVHGNGGGSLQWYVVVDGDGSSVIDSATTDVNGGQLTLSHVCFGAAPSFEQSFENLTDAPSEPGTDTLSGTGSNGPGDGSWLLVAAIGVLLASVVVMTPARVKSKR
jgi:hypothetical protein